ncbi:hypothetical protein ACVIIW_003659 [Bradyrhizobium sp. USDA 4449]
MTRKTFAATVAGMLAILAFGSAASASPCLRDMEAYRLAGDSIEWSMAIVPGTNCIQGLRWSTMQIYNVSVLEKPRNGELVLVGPGFRYFAKSDFSGTDAFTLAVTGKNRHDVGTSTVHVTISKSDAKPVGSTRT